jgi:hypothetical protein
MWKRIRSFLGRLRNRKNPPSMPFHQLPRAQRRRMHRSLWKLTKKAPHAA